MSKIDEYKEIKSRNLSDIQGLNQVMQMTADGSKHDARNDKGCMHIYDHAIWESDMPIYIHSAYGYYGSSSCYAVGGQNLKKYLIKALESMTTELMVKAKELLISDIELARKSAEKEALEVLGETKKDSTNA